MVSGQVLAPDAVMDDQRASSCPQEPSAGPWQGDGRYGDRKEDGMHNFSRMERRLEVVHDLDRRRMDQERAGARAWGDLADMAGEIASRPGLGADDREYFGRLRLAALDAAGPHARRPRQAAF